MDFASLRARLQLPLPASRSHCPHSSAARDIDGASGSPKLADEGDEDCKHGYQVATNRRIWGPSMLNCEHGIARPNVYIPFEERNIKTVCSVDDCLPSVELRERGIPDPIATGELGPAVRYHPKSTKKSAVNPIRRVHFSPRELCPSPELTSRKKLANKITQTVAIAAALNLPDYHQSTAGRLSSCQMYDVAVNTTSEFESEIACAENMSQKGGNRPLGLSRSRCRPCNAKDPRDSSSCSSEDSSELDSESQVQQCTPRLTSGAIHHVQSNAHVQPQPHVQQLAIVAQRELPDSVSKNAAVSAAAYYSHQRNFQLQRKESREKLITAEQSFPKDVIKSESLDHDDPRSSLASIAGIPQKPNQPSARVGTSLELRAEVPHNRFNLFSDAKPRDDHELSGCTSFESVADLPKNRSTYLKGIELSYFDARDIPYASLVFQRNMAQKKRLKAHRTSLLKTAPFAAQKQVTCSNRTSPSSYWFDVPFPPDVGEPAGSPSRFGISDPAANPFPVVNEGMRSKSSLGSKMLSGSVDGIDHVQQKLSREQISSACSSRAVNGRHGTDTMSPELIIENSTVYPGTLCTAFTLCPGDIMMTRNLRTEEGKIGGYLTLFPDSSYFEENGVEAASSSDCSGYYQFTLFDMVLRLGTFDNHDDWNWIPASFLNLFMCVPGHDRSTAPASWWLVDSKPCIQLPAPDHNLDHESTSMALNSRLQLDPRTTDLVISTIPDPTLACKKRWRAQWWSRHFLPLTQDVLIRACYDHPSHNHKSTMVAVELYSYCGDSAATWRFLGRDTYYYGNN